MAIRSALFSTPTHVMALGHPFFTPGYTEVEGVPIGIDARSRELVYGDPWVWKLIGLINGPFGIFLGPRGVGKSAAMKILAIRFLLLAAGYEQPRVSINDYKPEGKDSEYFRFTQFCRSTVFTMANMRVNPFERKLFTLNNGVPYELGILGVAEVLFELGKRSDLTGHENTALRVAMYIMLNTDEINWSPELLNKIVRSISSEQLQKYFKEMDKKLEAQLLARLQKVQKFNGDVAVTDQLTEELKGLVYARDNHKFEEIQSAGDRLSTYLSRIMEGKHGNMFGSENSLYEMSVQRASTKDWRGMDGEAETIMRTLMARISISAMENNQFNLIPHLEIDDEKHKPMGNLTYARTHSYESEVARGAHKANFSATHRLGSIRKGAPDSELFRLGETIINNLGFAFIGRQNNVKSILDEVQDRFRLPSNLRRALPTLPDYHFVMSLGEVEPPRIIRTFATPVEAEVIKTDGATERITSRPDIMDKDQLKAYGEANGIAYIGG